MHFLASGSEKSLCIPYIIGLLCVSAVAAADVPDEVDVATAAADDDAQSEFFEVL